jgi:phage host-nuclease inhibitor protein Gam
MSKKIGEQTTLASWEQVNQALQKIGFLNAAVDSMTGKYAEEHARIDVQAEKHISPLLTEKVALENNIKAFATAHKEELVNGKTKELPAGKVSFKRTRAALKLLNGATWKTVIEKMEELRMLQFLDYTPKVDKEKLKKEATEYYLSRIGLEKKSKEEFYYELSNQPKK